MKKEIQNDKFGELFTSITIGAVIFFLLTQSIGSGVTDSLMRDGSMLTGTRYTITQDALDTIAEDNMISVIGIGSSQMFKALDGGCVSENLANDALVYNIAQPSSRAYTDMLHIPRIVNSNPEVVLIEIPPNLLGNTSKSSEEYVELRFKLDTMNQDSSDIGDWVDLIDPEHRNWIALNHAERMKFKQEYFTSAVEERLSRILLNETTARDVGAYGWIPSSDSDEWKEYLQTPIFPADKYGFDGKTSEEREIYNATQMMKTGNYNPSYRGSQAHTALDYEISTLLENEIRVILVSPPHHPSALAYVEEGKWGGLNETLAKYSEWPGVTIFDQVWESGWVDDHFYDRNHLDDEGRIEFCQRVAPVVDYVLNSTDEEIAFNLDSLISEGESENRIETKGAGPKLLVITIDTEAGDNCRENPEESRGEEVSRCIYGVFGDNRAGIIEMMDVADQYGVQLSFFVDVMEIYAYSNQIVEVIQYIDGRGHDVQLHMHPSMINSTSWDEIKDTEQWNESGAVQDTWMNCWTQETADYWFGKSMEIFDEAGVKRPIAFRSGAYRYCDSIINAMSKFNMTQSYSYNMYTSNQNFSAGYMHNFEWENGIMEFPISYVKDENGGLRMSSRIDETTWSVSLNETFERFFEDQASTRVMTMILHSFSFLSKNGTGQYYFEDYSKLDAFKIFMSTFPEEYQIVTPTELQSYLDSGVIDSEFRLPLELISYECHR